VLNLVIKISLMFAQCFEYYAIILRGAVFLWTQCNVVVMCDQIKLFQNYLSLRRRPPELVLYQRVETCLKLFQNYFTG